MKRSRIWLSAALGLSLLAGCRCSRMSQCDEEIYLNDEIIVGTSESLPAPPELKEMPGPKLGETSVEPSAILPNVSSEPPMLAMPVGPVGEPKKPTATAKPVETPVSEPVWRTSPAVPMKPAEAKPAVPSRTAQQSVLEDRRAAAAIMKAEPARSEAELQEQPKATMPTPNPVVATPSSSLKPAPVALGERRVAGDFGHAADYGWLQGVVDRHYRGHLHLRYGDLTTEDEWGGKVFLDEDPRLKDLQDGDVVVVEGTLTPPDSTRNTWARYPHFRVNNVTVVQKKN